MLDDLNLKIIIETCVMTQDMVSLTCPVCMCVFVLGHSYISWKLLDHLKLAWKPC